MKSIITIAQEEALKARLLAGGTSKPDMIRQLALACLDRPYVFGAWGEPCTPANRRRRVRADHPTVRSRCPALNGKTCQDCRWGIGVRMYDCRGFTAWLIRQAGLDITGQGATSQYRTASNWARRGAIGEMPDCVCCVFRKVGKKMEHTGMHVGGGLVVDCSVNVRTGGMSGWTHYAIPAGLYGEEEIPVETIKPTLRKGAKGDLVKELQTRLSSLGCDCGAADGVFGAKTRSAVAAFQRARGLEPDGVCGPKTWAALEDAKPADAPTRRAACSGMTREQTARIRAICPGAMTEKEEGP